MYYLAGLPPELYEIINAALGAVSWVALAICVRYLATAYVHLRNVPTGLPEPPLSRLEAFYELRKLRLAIGLTVFLTGEAPRMTWLWWARYAANTGHDASWMAEWPYVTIPILASAQSVFGMGCVVRALTPLAWGRWGYVLAIGAAAWAVAVTQIVR